MSVISILFICSYLLAMFQGDRFFWQATRVLAVLAFLEDVTLVFGGVFFAGLIGMIFTAMIGMQAHAVLGGEDYLSRIRHWFRK